MKAMILAAGKGSRLSPLTDKTPKPLLPIQGRPLIEYIVKNLAREGYHEIVVNLHHLGDQIMGLLGDGSRYRVNITYSCLLYTSPSPRDRQKARMTSSD